MMAEEAKTDESQLTLPSFSETQKKKARAWFKQAEAKREQRDYDYAIECYTQGLNFWPEAVEAGHKPLRSLAVQRTQAGGKKPGMMEGLKHSMAGKDVKKAMLNAEYLMAKDPQNAGYIDGVLKNAGKGLFLETLVWIAPIAFESMKKEKKPNQGRFKNFRQVLAEAADQASAAGAGPIATHLLEQAVNSVDFLVARGGTDDALRDEQRDLSGRLTIVKGKYSDSESFRDSIQDSDSQKRLHDAERSKQGVETQRALLDAARQEFAEHPDDTRVLNKFVDALVRTEAREYEDEAVQVLEAAYQRDRNYAHKSRADDIRLRQLQRQVRQARAAAQQSGSDDDKQQARLSAKELIQLEGDVYRERVKQYPTDLRMKYRLGRALFAAHEFDEAIPVLQQAQGDPRSRLQARVLMGRAFFENGSFGQAREVLRETLDEHETPADDTGKELLFWLARACEENQEHEAASDYYGKLLRLDYNYANGEARQRLERLKQSD
jgi:chaperonin cofactor prefoldin